MAAPTEIEQQQMSFTDANGGEEVCFENAPISTFDSAALSSLGLGEFLSRPVLIDTFDWAENAFAAHTFNPWGLFLSDTIIKRKIENYGLWRGKLHLKFIISASPFYYGLALVSYNPFPETHQGPQVVVGGDQQMVTYSQRPHIWIDPSTSRGGEIECPFFYNQNWCVNDFTTINRLGTIRYDSPFVLRNANSVAGANVTIRCYAWMENVELSAPTTELQSKRTSRIERKKKKPSVAERLADFSSARDEYGSGPVSNIASAVANAGAALSNVPVIGPLARATEIGAGALSRVAAWFGYTNIPVISDVMPFKDLPFGGFASSEVSAPTPKLTLDPKNELTLDPRTVGLDGTDELSLESYVGRESYLTYFDWDTSDASNSTLWAAGVSPAQMYRKGDSNKGWFTPLAHACTMYQYWTGDVIFRFQVVCTPYHRGRFKIQFEPSDSFTPGTDVTNETANITRIYDIGETRDVEICIPWMQAKAFLNNSGVFNSPVAFAANPASLTGVVGNNGFLYVGVVSELTSPVADAPVSIVVSVRAGDNFKLMGPIAPPKTLQWTLQSAVSEKLGATEESEPAINLVYGGETALSLRQLMHRHGYVRGMGGDFGDLVYRSTFYMYPPTLNTSADSKNIHDAGLGARRNYVAHTFESWIAPCFAGKRGSMYWAVNIGGDGGGWRARFTRSPGASLLPTSVDSLLNIDDTDASNYSYSQLAINDMDRFANGSALYNTRTQSGVTSLVPYISNLRFVGTMTSPFLTSTTLREGVSELIVRAAIDSPSVVASTQDNVDFYCATGPDYNCFFFTGVPTITISVSIPAPV